MTQILIYENVTPVSSANHKDLSIELKNFDFASKVSAVPLTAVEIPLASREYAIVFAGDEKAVSPMVVLGVEGETNLFLDEDKSWKADYLPAFIRRYPFVFSRSEDGKKFALCVDEKWSGCNREGKGERLFTEAGEKTAFTQKMLDFLEDYQRQFALTQQFAKTLLDLGVLEMMQANVTLPSGDKRTLRGFYGVSRKKLMALDDAKLAELAKSNVLELAYLQMASMNNLRYIVNRFVPKNPKDVEPKEPNGGE